MNNEKWNVKTEIKIKKNILFNYFRTRRKYTVLKLSFKYPSKKVHNLYEEKNKWRLTFTKKNLSA